MLDSHRTVAQPRQGTAQPSRGGTTAIPAMQGRP